MNPHTEASVIMEHFPPYSPSNLLFYLVARSPSRAKKIKPINIFFLLVCKTVVKTCLLIIDAKDGLHWWTMKQLLIKKNNIGVVNTINSGII